MSFDRKEIPHDATPYRKPDGKWYVLRKVDATTLVEKPATDAEIERAKADARAKLAALEDAPSAEAPAPKPKGKAKK